MKPIYLDYNATTPTDPAVIESMLPFLYENFGNPANILNQYGWTAENAVKEAAKNVADLIHCQPQELVWNAGATEGNNTVVFALIRKLKQLEPNEKIHFITSQAEHWSVINSFKAAEKFEGIELDLIPVNQDGIVTVQDLKKYIKPHTKLVSLMWVNNEIGSINPVKELAEFCQQNKIYFHTDATQALGKIDVDLQKTPVHFLTFSAHKFYGPKGVGCLFTRAMIQLDPFLFGGGQQRNQRSGTLNVPSIVGTGTAAKIAKEKMHAEAKRTRELLKKLYTELKIELPDLKINGPDLENTDLRSPVNLSLQFNKQADLVLPELSKIAFSLGSACSTAGTSSSHVLKAIGLTDKQAQSTIRLSIGRWTTESDIRQAAETLIKAFKPC
ncbi:MAG: cysteine desulfurase [Bdellovibrio sp.]|nr:cysteine desulfurase [Bdellovibrio sp.]